MNGTPTRRRFRFGLRSLFIFVTLVAIWAAYSANWIRERREFVRKLESDPMFFVIVGFDSAFSAPGLLWLFGEHGVESIVLPNETDAAEARRLFPEAARVDVEGRIHRPSLNRRSVLSTAELLG